MAGVAADRVPRTVDLGGALGNYRVVAVAAGDGDVLVIGLPLASTGDAVLRLVAVEVAAGPLAVLAAAGAGFLVLRRTLRPLHRVAATAGRVAELPLSTGEVRLAERVPEADTDPHTEVGRVGTALNRLLDHVEDSLAARHASETQVRQFVADASHELRTPVTSIRGYAELVRRQGSAVPDDVAQALRRVEGEAVRMSDLVDDLLLLARLDAGRELADDPVDLTALVLDVVSDAHAAGPGHHWRVDLPPAAVQVTGDESRLHQVLANLLANVRTHTPARHHGRDPAARRGRLGGARGGRRRTGHPTRAAGIRCSSGSRAATPRARGTPAAPAWGWPSCRPSSPVPAAPCRSRASPAARRSPSGCPARPSSSPPRTRSPRSRP